MVTFLVQTLRSDVNWEGIATFQTFHLIIRCVLGLTADVICRKIIPFKLCWFHTSLFKTAFLKVYVKFQQFNTFSVFLKFNIFRIPPVYQLFR